MEIIKPRSESELAAALRQCAEARQSVQLGGQFSKTRLGGPAPATAAIISTVALSRVLRFEPRDLTISVEAGMPFGELRSLLKAHHVQLPLDPPFAADSTVGGVVAANLSGPRRRLFGSVRDMVIGMRFATLDGAVVQSGGVVVKNVAGLDMAKLMIGSFGTLAAITVVNFRLFPVQPCSATFIFQFATLAEAAAQRDRILQSALQPVALDLANPAAARLLGFDGALLLVRVEGSAAVVARYRRELAGAAVIEETAEAALWQKVQEFVPMALAENSEATVIRVSTKLQQTGNVLASFAAPAVARAGNGVVYACLASPTEAAEWLRGGRAPGWKAVVEATSPAGKTSLELWPSPGGDFLLMRKIKHLFDPHNLLNPGRLYGRL